MASEEKQKYLDMGYESRPARLLGAADRKDEQGKMYQAEQKRLQAEYGTQDPDKIAKAMAAKQLREFKDDPFRASGYGDRARESMQRAMQGVRSTTQAGLRSELNRLQMTGAVSPDTAIQAFGEADERASEVEAQQLGALAAQIRDKISGEGQRRVAAFIGAQVPTPIRDEVEMQMVTQVIPGILQEVGEGRI